MSDLSTQPINLDDPVSEEMNLYLFFKGIADDVNELEHEILEHLVAAGTARGWFPTVERVVARISEHEKEADVLAALARLQRQRLLVLSEDRTQVRRIISGITHEKTRFRAMTAEHVPFFLVSALDALTVAPTLQKSVHVQTTCGVSGAKIEFEVSGQGELVVANPHSVTAFVPGWDGQESIADALGPNSHFFESDERLREWQATHGDPAGMPLSQDTFRFVGMEMARALGALYVRMSVMPR